MSYRLPFKKKNKCEFLRTPKIILGIYSLKKCLNPGVDYMNVSIATAKKNSEHMNKRADLYIHREYICQLYYFLCRL